MQHVYAVYDQRHELELRQVSLLRFRSTQLFIRAYQLFKYPTNPTLPAHSSHKCSKRKAATGVWQVDVVVAVDYWPSLVVRLIEFVNTSLSAITCILTHFIHTHTFRSILIHCVRVCALHFVLFFTLSKCIIYMRIVK